MNKWTPANKVEAYLVVPPQLTEQIYAGITNRSGTNLRCMITATPRPNTVTNEFTDGTHEVISFGDDRWDMQIQFQVASRETAILIERIKRLNVPVYVYPKVGGTVQFAMPLVRGLGTDPVDGATVTNAHAVSTGTTMYLPRAVAGIGEKLFPVSDSIALAPGIPQANNDMASFLFDHGIGVFTPRLNLLKYSNLSSITQAAPAPTDGWYAGAGSGGTWDTDMGSNDSPWCAGEKTFWTTNAAVTLTSYKFDLSSLTKDPQFSCYAMVDGSATARIKNSIGTIIASRSIPAGSGRFQTTFTGITPGSYVDCRMEFLLASGSYMEIGQPQLINPGTEQIAEYLPYLGTDSAVQGELTDDGITITDVVFRNNYQRPEATGSNRDNAIAVSAFWQAGSTVDSESSQNTLLFLEHYTTASIGDIELRFGWYATGSTHEFAIYSGGVRQAGASVASFKEGDVFSLVLGSGNDGATTHSTMSAVNMRTGDVYTASAPGSPLHVANRLFIGRRSTADYQCDGIMGGVSVDSMPYSSLADWAERLGNHDLMDLARRTAGKWYNLVDNSTYRQFTRQAYQGSHSLRQARAI